MPGEREILANSELPFEFPRFMTESSEDRPLPDDVGLLDDDMVPPVVKR